MSQAPLRVYATHPNLCTYPSVVKEQMSQPVAWSNKNSAYTIYIAANPPELFVIIRKSKLEYEFLNDDFCFQIMKIRLFFYLLFFSKLFTFFKTFFFLPPVFHRRHSTSACRNQHLRTFSDFVLQRMRCRLQLASRSCACAPFASASGGTPRSRTLPR